MGSPIYLQGEPGTECTGEMFEENGLCVSEKGEATAAAEEAGNGVGSGNFPGWAIAVCVIIPVAGAIGAGAYVWHVH